MCFHRRRSPSRSSNNICFWVCGRWARAILWCLRSDEERNLVVSRSVYYYSISGIGHTQTYTYTHSYIIKFLFLYKNINVHYRYLCFMFRRLHAAHVVPVCLDGHEAVQYNNGAHIRRIASKYSSQQPKTTVIRFGVIYYNFGGNKPFTNTYAII